MAARIALMVRIRGIGWQAAIGEAAAFATATLSLPLRWLLPDERLDSTAPQRTPVVLVHGLFGDPTNFVALRSWLARRGLHSFASFSYGARLDYPRLALGLGEMIDRVRSMTGSRQVDVVGHSLGGLVGRYFTEMDDQRAVRRLVTLGAPYYAGRFPRHELAIFAAEDSWIVPPSAPYGPRGRIRVVPGCGHLGLLYHPAVLRRVVAYLTRPVRGTSEKWTGEREAA